MAKQSDNGNSEITEAKYYRPDIQLLEARANKLKVELKEYVGLKTYQPTRKRMTKIALDLEECLESIYQIINDNSDTLMYSAAISTSTSIRESEFSSGNDESSDLGNLSLLGEADPILSPREIVGGFATRVEQLEKATIGMIPINHFCKVLSTWYHARFVPDEKDANEKFNFKSTNIPRWVDCLIIAAGQAMHDGRFYDFCANLEEWVDFIHNPQVDPKERKYPLPYGILKVERTYTPQALVIEWITKYTLYDSEFFPSMKSSLRDAAVREGTFTEADVTFDNLLATCQGSIALSSLFDTSIYQ